VRQWLKAIPGSTRLWFAASNLRAQKLAALAASIETPYLSHVHITGLSKFTKVAIMFFTFGLLTFLILEGVEPVQKGRLSSRFQDAERFYQLRSTGVDS
jgi:hypothetical protein